MKRLIHFVLSRVAGGLLVIAPIYLAALLLTKVASSLADMVRPLSKLLPAWMPGAHVLSLLLVLVVCFLIGYAMSTSMGRSAWQSMENALFQKIPGYALFRSMTQQLAGRSQEKAWKPALAEIEEALVPAFIIEELQDGRSTVFVPAAPTPLSGSIYILTPDRIHPVSTSFAQALKAVTHWGSGCQTLVAAMQADERDVSGQRAA